MAKNSGRKRVKKESSRTKRIKLIFGLVSGTVLFLLFLLFKYDPLVPSNKEDGSIINVFNAQSRYGSRTYYVIELDSGKNVSVNASWMGPYKKGRRVVVEKMESRIFHKSVYRFVEYKD